MKYDILIVGSGPGGYVAAIRAAQLGKKVALVERAEPGGVCLNWGCIPTKALLKSAQVYGYCKNAEHYGLEFAGEVRPDLEKIVARSRGVAETMSKGVRFLLNKNGIDLIPGFGRLTAPGRLDVDGTEYEADHIVLATGARPREMAFMPVDGEHVISSRQALTLDRLPESMIVVGSGAIGSEFAWFYAALGVKVTIIEYMPRMMPLEDEEVSKTMERAFRKLRATVLTSTTVKAVKVNAEGLCEVEIEGKKGAETLTAGIVLSAVGIKSNIEGIGLEELGIAVERDKIVVDKFYRTNVPGVYAIGDCRSSWCRTPYCRTGHRCRYRQPASHRRSNGRPAAEDGSRRSRRAGPSCRPSRAPARCTWGPERCRTWQWPECRRCSGS